MSGARALLVTGCFLFARAAAGAIERCPGGLATRIVPLPVYATLPNEGDTFGAMPVFLRVCDANARTESIIAPSITWNDVIHWTGTFRLFHYPSDEQSLTFIASASTRINSGVLLQWRDLPRAPRQELPQEEPRLLVVEVEQAEQSDDDVVDPQPAEDPDQGDVSEPDERRRGAPLHCARGQEPLANERRQRSGGRGLRQHRQTITGATGTRNPNHERRCDPPPAPYTQMMRTASRAR